MNEPILSVAHRLNENIWFEAFQPLLLRIANTREGRDLLCIDQDFPTIHRFYKNAIHSYLGEDTWRAEFRVGAKWANVIRHRWEPFKVLAKRFYETEQNNRPATMLWTPEFMFAAHATDTFFPDPSPETTSVDGQVGDSAMGSSWDTAHDSTSQSANDTATTLLVRTSESAASSNYSIFRTFILFDTSSLPDGNTISAADIQMYVNSTVNTDDDGDDFIRVVTTTPASNTAIVDGDFDQCGSIDNPTAQANDVDIGSLTTSQYNTWTLNATGIGNIDKAGISKFGLREGHDVLDSPVQLNVGNEVNMSSADETGTSQDPKLTVTHSLVSTFTPKVIVF